MKIVKIENILVRRKEIGGEVIDMLKETNSPSSTTGGLRGAGNNFTLEDVGGSIYNEEDNDDFHQLIAMFDRGGDVSEFSNVLELVTDAWNYFPHKVLGGISPAEKLLEHKNNVWSKNILLI